MKRLLLLLLLLIRSNLSFANNIEVCKRDTIKTEIIKSYFFDVIDSKFDATSIEKVAVLRGFSTHTGKTTLPNLFSDLWKLANKLGANSYIIDSIIDKSDSLFVHLSVYHLTENQADSNLRLYPTNMIYVFGDLDTTKIKRSKIEFNYQEKTLPPLTYFGYQNKVKEKAVISIGGAFGSTMKIKGKMGKLPAFLSLQGFNIGSGTTVGSNGIGISFNTGKIYPVELSLGQFLIQILKEVE